MKNIFSTQDMLASTESKQNLDCATPYGTVYFDCHVIYIITCSSCSL